MSERKPPRWYYSRTWHTRGLVFALSCFYHRSPIGFDLHIGLGVVSLHIAYRRYVDDHADR